VEFFFKVRNLRLESTIFGKFKASNEIMSTHYLFVKNLQLLAEILLSFLRAFSFFAVDFPFLFICCYSESKAVEFGVLCRFTYKRFEDVVDLLHRLLYNTSLFTVCNLQNLYS